MPVRSLNSSVLRWPDAEAVVGEARRWAKDLAAREPAVLAVGYFGSYARGEAGVGSDLDLVVIVGDGAVVEPAGEAWATERFPVPVDRVVYTTRQWADLRQSRSRFYRTLCREAKWLVGAPPGPAS